MSHQLTTHRLILRPFVLQYAAAVAALVGDYDVVRWLTRAPYPYAEADAVEFIRRHADSKGVLAITSEGTVIGTMSIGEELGYWVGKPYWGKGFATEAATAKVADHFTSGHDVLHSGHLIANAASRRVLCKLGFSDTRVEDAPSLSLGCSVKIQRMQLDRATWETRA